MRAVAARDEVAVEPYRFAAMTEAHVGLRRRDVEEFHVVRFGEQIRVAPIGRGEEIRLDVRLAVDHELLADVLLHVDEEAVATGPDDLHSVVHVALAIHAFRQPVGAQHVDRRLFENAGADACQHVFARVLLEHDAFHPVPVQDFREQKPRGTTADDGDLSSHRPSVCAPQIL